MLPSNMGPERFLQSHPDPETALRIRQQMDEVSILIEKLNARQASSNKVIVLAATMFLTTSVAYTISQFADVNTTLSACMPSPYKLFEYGTARRLLLRLARLDLLPVDFASEDPYLIRDVDYSRRHPRTRPMRLCVPIGLSAGIDLNSDGPAGLLKLGFGSIEVGTVYVTPQESVGENEVEILDSTVVASVGRRDATDGLAAVSDRLCKYIENRSEDLLTRNTVTGISIGVESCEDVVRVFQDKRLIASADYVSLDVSGLVSEGAVKSVIQRVDDCAAASDGSIPPIFLKLKLSQSLPPSSVVAAAISASPFVVGVNINGSGIASSRNGSEVSISGSMVRDKSNEAVSAWYVALGSGGRGKEIIASGGVACGKDALDKIEAGAGIVQVFSAFVIDGAQVARRIKTQLSIQMMNRGYYNLAEAVGAKHRQPSKRLKEALRRRKRF